MTFVGVLAAIEPVRSRTVLNIMDGLRGVWHAGPFSTDMRYRFYPEADEVQHRSGGDGSPAHRRHRRQAQAGGRDLGLGARHEVLQQPDGDWQANPNVNRFIREPGHIEYASTLGLGVYDLKKIQHTEITV